MIEKLIKLLKIKFAGNLVLKDGTNLIIEGDLALGVQVKVQGPDGVIPLPAGSYELETGQIITVDEKGVIVDIVDQVSVPEEPDEEEITLKEEPVTLSEEKPVEEEIKVEVKQEEEVPVQPEIKIEDLLNTINELKNKISELETKQTNLSEETLKVTEQVNFIKEKAHFPKELSKNSTPDEVISSNPKVAMIEQIRKLKK